MEARDRYSAESRIFLIRSLRDVESAIEALREVLAIPDPEHRDNWFARHTGEWDEFLRLITIADNRWRASKERLLESEQKIAEFS